MLLLVTYNALGKASRSLHTGLVNKKRKEKKKKKKKRNW